MHLLFLDESGRLDQDDLFALGGIAVRDSDWHLLRDTWRTRVVLSAETPILSRWAIADFSRAAVE